MRVRSECSCGKLFYNAVFTCSGSADVGLLADRAARALAAGKSAAMFCNSAIGAGVPEMLELTEGAGQVLAIDGCEKACALKVLEKAGFTGSISLRLDALGMEKGKTPMDEALVEKVAGRARELLDGPVCRG